jgi:hypothetical protein
MVNVRAVRLLEENVELKRLPSMLDLLIHNMSNGYHSKCHYEQNYVFNISIMYCADELGNGQDSWGYWACSHKEVMSLAFRFFFFSVSKP